MRKLLVLASLFALLGPVARADAFTKMTDVRVAMDDGVVLTADVYVPTIADRDGDGFYPCVVELTPYRKENRASEGASFLPGQGIALIEVDARGTGGSAGQYDIVFSVREQRDMAQWVDWAATGARKPNGDKLCETTVGAYGGSYSGIIQYLTASLPLHPGDVGYGQLPMGSPYLTAIAPQRAYGDLYRDIVYHGGMVIGSFGAVWSTGTTAYYTQPPTDVSTPAGQLAWFDHLTKNDPMIKNYLAAPYADATFSNDDLTQRLYDDSSVLPRIENLRVPTLHLAGWFDGFTRGQIRTFTENLALERARNDRGPNHLIVGPWNHTGTHFITPDVGFRQHLADWYHHWLEDRANPAAWMSGPRITYFQMTSGTVNAMGAADGTWRTSDVWPPAGTTAVKVPLEDYDRQGSASCSGTPPYTCYWNYAYAPNHGAAETWSRWDNTAGIPVPQQQLDQRAEATTPSFESAPFTAPFSIAGPIAAHLVIGSRGVPGDPSLADEWPGEGQVNPPYHDFDIVVKISDVAPDGKATLVTQGYLRASHRAVDASKSQFIGSYNVAPYHPHTLDALDPPPADGSLRAYDIEIWPTAKTFDPGHQLRIDVMAADTPNHISLVKPAANVLEWGFDGGSYIVLPVVPS